MAEISKTWRDTERLLLRVEKPARYIGGEFNIVTKPDAGVRVRLALAFPDVYEIGMSYHGFRILYERINAVPQWQAERVFAPWPDFEALLRQNEIPLYTLESKRPVQECDVIGFTLQHEMSYTNLLNMLDLARIPVFSAERHDSDPIVVAGGHGALNPELMAEFVDAFVIGDGEEVLAGILQAVEQRGGSSREELLVKLASIPGVYVPRFYDCEYLPDGTIAHVRPNRPGIPPVIQRQVFDLRQDVGPVRPIVPIMRIVQDRIAIEIKRGCTTGCRFCHAGMITRPLRERDPRQVVEIAREALRNTGHTGVSLLSLSSADHSGIVEMTRALRREFASDDVSVSLPSTRINAFDVDLVEEIGSVRKSGFTFAPEAGSMRLREIINKNVDEEHLYATVERVLEHGWRTLKFYFMCGLPGETEEDLQGIVDLTKRVTELGRRRCGNAFTLNVSLAPFVPKPHTPFQWHGQPTLEEFEEKYRFVESRLNRRAVSLKKHGLRESALEGVLSRGDRRVGRAIHEAWKMGCKFDGWREHFRYDLWQEAFGRAGVDPLFYANRARSEDEVLPWDHISSGVSKKFLLGEKRRSETGQTTEACDGDHCSGCAVCDFKTTKNVISAMEDEPFTAPPAKEAAPRPKDPAQRVRLVFTKQAGLRFTSHLDLIEVVETIFRRAGVPLAYSQGFNPSPRLQFTPPLPLGFGSEGEILDVDLAEEMPATDVLQRLRSIQLDGLEWKSAEKVELRGSLVPQLSAAMYRVELAEGADREKLAAALDGFAGASEFWAELPRKGKTASKDLKQGVMQMEVVDGRSVEVVISLAQNAYVNPVHALRAIVGADLLGEALCATRTGFLWSNSTGKE